ncbi:MAG: glutathione S-transferase family protein [Marinibacterium sp.]
MYTVYGNVKSRTFRVLWMLEEIGAPYTHVPAAPQSAEIRAVSAAGKLPALDVDGTVLTDSVAILTYLADAHGALTFPAGSLDRARQDSLTHRILDEFDAVLWAASRLSMILPAEYRVPAAVDSLKWEFGRNLARLDADFAGPYLMGDTMTIADILLGHCLGWATVAQFPVQADRLTDYFRALRGRDAYKRIRSMV